MTDPVAVTVRRRVRPGHEKEYEAWPERLTEGVAQGFPGYLGAEFHRPGADGSYRSVSRFDSPDSLDAFERSEFRAAMLAEAAPLFAADAAWKRMTGLEFWIDPPPGTKVPQPSPHRMALVLIAVVFALVLVAIQIGLMTYVIMPRLTPLIAFHLSDSFNPLKGNGNDCQHRHPRPEEDLDHRRQSRHLAHDRLAIGILVGRIDPSFLGLRRGRIRDGHRQPQGRRPCDRQLF